MPSTTSPLAIVAVAVIEVIVPSRATGWPKNGQSSGSLSKTSTALPTPLTGRTETPTGVPFTEVSALTVPFELATLVHKLLAPQLSDRTQTAASVRDQLRSLASREVTQGAQGYGITVPTVLREAPPQLRSILDTVLTASPPRLRALWDFVGRLPRKALWGGLAAAVIVMASIVIASLSSAPEESPPAPVAASRVEAVVVNTPPPVEPPAVAPDAPDVQAQLDVLSQSKNRRERVAAARWLERPPQKAEVPPFATALARLELGSDCQAQATALRRLRTLGDPRALPAVEHWYAKPRTGCGLLGNRDSLACVRDEMGTTRRALKRAQERESGS